MLIIGSRALAHHGILPEGRVCKDWDFICTFAEFQQWTKDNKAIIRHCVPLSGSKFHVRDADGMNYEFEIAWPDTSGEYLLNCFDVDPSGVTHAEPDTLLFLKLSHRYLKDSPHFLKTMRDIQHLRSNGVKLSSEHHDIMALREAETYVYKHPKLDVSKGDFFTGDGVEYVYDHDSIHLTQALHEDVSWPEDVDAPVTIMLPAYTFYMKDGSEVMTSKEKFMSRGDKVKIAGVYEESCVLALERSQIPHGKVHWGPLKAPVDGPSARWSFEMALMKVCSSITSGWFREYAWENYDKVLDLYNELGEEDYIERFKRNQHLLRPYVGGTEEAM